MLYELRKDVQKEASEKKAIFLSRFFKTGKGEYAEGDVFLGLTVPQARKIVAKYQTMPLEEVLELLKSKFHEERLIALLIMVFQFYHFAKASRDKKKDEEKVQKAIYQAYLANTKYINNWDLVDLSAREIVGGYLLYEIASSSFDKLRSPRNDILEKLAHSKDLWERRIAMIATFAFIRNGESELTFKIADILLNDKHDLIHKAVGWMLREVGKRCGEDVLEAYLKSRYKKMPRTMLRYSIEHFEEGKRKKYLAGAI